MPAYLPHNTYGSIIKFSSATAAYLQQILMHQHRLQNLQEGSISNLHVLSHHTVQEKTAFSVNKIILPADRIELYTFFFKKRGAV